MIMDDIKTAAAIQTLVEQRNAALNVIADQAGEIASLKRDIAILEAELDKSAQPKKKKKE